MTPQARTSKTDWNALTIQASHRGLNALQGNPDDLITTAQTDRLISYGGRSDEPRDRRPIIVDYDTGSQGRVSRMMYWKDDAIGGTGERKCCMRFEVMVIKPGRKAHHQIGDYCIWSQTLQDVLNNPVLEEFMLEHNVNSKVLRTSLKDQGFTDEAKTF